MSILSVAQRLRYGAVLVSTAAVLGACGGPIDGEEQADPSVSAQQITPPSASISCTRSNTTYQVSCTGTGSGGVTPYTYQWQEVDDFGGGSTSSYWYNGGTTYTSYCRFGFFTYGTYFTKYIRFRVIDANGYVSNQATKTYNCWTPN
jgi:hypothetical protein